MPLTHLPDSSHQGWTGPKLGEVATLSVYHLGDDCISLTRVRQPDTVWLIRALCKAELGSAFRELKITPAGVLIEYLPTDHDDHEQVLVHWGMYALFWAGCVLEVSESDCKRMFSYWERRHDHM